ncbi:hypothetical protein GQ53DRAFT_703728, partial [Thozetella sp. PMI_491]
PNDGAWPPPFPRSTCHSLKGSGERERKRVKPKRGNHPTALPVSGLTSAGQQIPQKQANLPPPRPGTIPASLPCLPQVCSATARDFRPATNKKTGGPLFGLKSSSPHFASPPSAATSCCYLLPPPPRTWSHSHKLQSRSTTVLLRPQALIAHDFKNRTVVQN